MPSTYIINGKPVTREAYEAFVAANPLPPVSTAVQDRLRSDKQLNPNILGEAGAGLQSQGAGPSSTSFQDPRTVDISKGPVRDLGGVTFGAEAQTKIAATEVQVRSLPGNSAIANSDKDMRVKIRVPLNYITPLTEGSSDKELSALRFGGIIFPYTPQISYEHKAEYTTQQPLHSNYAINFYKNSSIGDITITGKFTVQNEKEGLIYLATVRLLRALTKMRWGGKIGDADSGAPPPVCRLDGYGEFLFKNVPVVITSFKNDLPDDVDFFTVGKDRSAPFGLNSVPTRSTISVTCKVAYSRAEMQQISVTKYLDPTALRGKGYL
jgi:hypothetical protein